MFYTAYSQIFILDNAGMSRHSLAQSERKLKVQGENALMRKCVNEFIWFISFIWFPGSIGFT